ncbi:DUF4838 domain-containing protein [Paenibacillus ginsengarvi]|nr:DUF4838 domain-containing protein [Paenibacillus ginsengarvi]
MGTSKRYRKPMWLCVGLAILVAFLWNDAPSRAYALGTPLHIVENGTAHAVILVPEQADPVIARAAGELAEYVLKSTGATLPIMTEAELQANGGGLNGHVRIYVGDSGSDPHMSTLLSGLNSDGFAIHPHGTRIVIAGSTPSGTLYGVYEFLERYAGVRWLMPGDNGEDVPSQTDLDVPDQDVVMQPAFFSRVFSPGVSWTQAPERSDWLDKNRLHNQIQFHHNLLKLFPPSKYGSTHPEYFPVRNGQPYIPPTDSTHGWQPCFTAPGIVQEAIQNIIQYFGDHPEETSYSLGMNDSGGFCEANPAHPDYPNKINSIGLVDMSDIYYGWVNQVVEGVLDVYPDKWFGLLAYQEVMDPPSFALTPRVVPFLTKDRMAWADPAVEAAGKAQVAAWAAVSDNLAWYDYMYGTPYLLPRVYNHLMADNYKYAKQAGVSAHYAELYPNWGEGPKPWLSAKLQWDPDADEDALLQEWYVRAVGPTAAADLAAYYDHWEQFWTDRVLSTDWFQSRKMTTYLEFNYSEYLNLVTDQEIADSRALLESVVAKAQTAPQKARANLLLRAFEYYEASALSYPKDEPAPTDSTSALALLDGLDTRRLNLQKRLTLVDEFKSDPVLAHPLDPRTYSLEWPLWNAGTFWNLVAYLKQEEPGGGTVTSHIAGLAASGSPSEQAFAKLLQEAVRGLFPLEANGSFENGTTSASSWANWIQSIGTIQRSTENPRTGAAGLKIQGLDRGGPVQVMPVKPGLFAARAYYSAPNGYNGKGTIQLAINLRDAAGKQIGTAKGKTVPLSAGAGVWRESVFLYDIPALIGGAEVKSAQFIVIVDGVQDSTVYVDDVSVYQANDSMNLASNFWRVLDYIRTNEPLGGPLKQSVTDTVYGTVYGSVYETERNWAKLLLRVVDSAPSEAINSSFETGSGASAASWSYWYSSTGSISRTTEAARSGQYGLKIKDIPRGGPNQTITASPGLFAAEVWYTVKPGTPPNGTIQLSVNFLDAQGKTIANALSEVRALSGAAPGAWSPLGLKAAIPAAVNGTEVKKLQIVIIADKVQNGAELLVDDLMLYTTPNP